MPASPRFGDFSAQASAYARARPGYPPELVDRLIERAGVGAADPVADLGAGTGLLTRMLAERGLIVTAVEPNAAMRAAAAAPIPRVIWVDGSFGATNLPDASQRWAVAAQAFHWADPAQALPEVRRILRPGGCFSVLWNNRRMDKGPVLTWTRDAIRRHIGNYEEAYRAGQDWTAALTSTGDFREVVFDQAENVVPMSRDRYLDLWRSHNRLSITAGPERFAAFLADLGARLLREGVEEVQVPYLCRAWTARRC